MIARPRAVFWARTGPEPGARMCLNPGHGVYERRIIVIPGDPDSDAAHRAVAVWACGVCWPEAGAKRRPDEGAIPGWDGWGDCLEGPLIGDGRRGCGAGPETTAKHDRHRGTLVPYVAVMRKHAHRFPANLPQVLLLDLTSGPLRYRDAAGVAYTGTGALALESFDAAGLRSTAVFFEQVAAFAAHAGGVVARRPRPDLGQSLVLNGDAWGTADETLAGLMRQFRWRKPVWPYGLVSLDANGEPDLEALGALYQRFPALLFYVDIWIHLPAQIMKWIRVVHGRGLLRDRVLRLPKTVWKIRRSTGGRLGWVELVGTNWDDAPTWRRQGFLDLRMEEGQAALNAETFTQAEQRERVQPALPLDE